MGDRLLQHEELLRELAEVQDWPLSKRMKWAKRRRKEQFRHWKRWIETEEANAKCERRRKKSDPVSLEFASEVVLLESSARNDVEEVADLLSKGVFPNLCNVDGLTALHQCCIDNCIDLATVLLDHDANVNAQDVEMWTPLHAASRCGHYELVRLLIDRGANLLAINSDGQMPFEIAETSIVLAELQEAMEKDGIDEDIIEAARNSGPIQMLKDVQELFEEKKPLTLSDENGDGVTLLHIAAANGYSQVVDFLLSKDVPVDPMDRDGWTPLHAASCWGQYDVIESLAEYGANLDALTGTEETPIMLASDQNITLLLHDLKTRQLERAGRNKSRPRSRTFSSSSRGHSVKRDSVNKKSNFSKRDAAEEGKHLRTGDDPSVDDIEGVVVEAGDVSESEPSVFDADSVEAKQIRRSTSPPVLIPPSNPSLVEEPIEEEANNGSIQQQNDLVVPELEEQNSRHELIGPGDHSINQSPRRKLRSDTDNGCCRIL